MILQLSPSIPVETLNQGTAQAFLVIDYGEEYDLFFTVALDSNGQIWTINSKDIRFIKNITLGRDFDARKAPANC